MFCPKCGNADQSPESYCRQCGTFLPDLDKKDKSRNTPEEHVKVNTVLSSLTIVTCFTLSVLLYTLVAFRENTHPLIYVTASLLLAMGIWHIQTLWRTILLRKYLKKSKPPNDSVLETGAATGKLLEEADFENVVPASVTDHTTKHLTDPHNGQRNPSINLTERSET